MIFRIFVLLNIISAMLLFTNCEDVTDPDNTPPAIPRGLTSVTGDGKVYLSWYPNAESDLAGYNVYFSFSAEGTYKKIGNTTSAYFIDADVDNGTTYYYAVTAYDNSRNESELSTDLVFDTPRPEGFGVTLYDYNLYPNDAGYNFSRYQIQHHALNSTDIYFEYNRQNDGYYMNIGHPETNIQDFGYTETLDAVNYAPESGWSRLGWVELIQGHSYIVWTSDNHFAKFRVTQISPTQVKFDWAYQIDPGNPELAKPAKDAFEHASQTN
ncbi:hypothetical protein JXJ21_10510 [candidate division KSB1 bacterium]|nr:hypothetical protein [candidate division KSB1 bacterium]